MDHPRRAPHAVHAVILNASQWSQAAAAHLLHRAVSHGGRVTMVVPRRDERLFATRAPAIREWAQHPSLRHAIDQLADLGQPIGYIYDDHLDALLGQLARERREGVLVVVYVASGAEEHILQAPCFLGFADTILVEKPASLFFMDLENNQLLKKSASVQDCRVLAAEHYLFRPGVTEAYEQLMAFITRHANDKLAYTFCFHEAAGHDDPNRRLGAYRDGALMDVGVVHGLGPVDRVLLPALGRPRGLADPQVALVWEQVIPLQARDERGDVKVATLAETAVELRGTLRVPDKRPITILLKSAKGCAAYSRYFEVKAEETSLELPDQWGGCCLFGVSLGAVGHTIQDRVDGRLLYVVQHGGHLSDLAGGRGSVAGNAQAMMLTAVQAEHQHLDPRFLSMQSACRILQLGIEARAIAVARPTGQPEWPAAYLWGQGPDRAIEALRGGVSQPPDSALTAACAELYSSGAGLSLIRKALGLDHQQPSPHRILTCYGPEGAINTDIARWLERELGENGLCVHIPRDELHLRHLADAQRHFFTLGEVVRRIASWVGVALPPGSEPWRALVQGLRKRRVAPGETPRRLLILNGVDRLSAGGWVGLVRVLNELPDTIRVCLITSRADQAAGLVLDSLELAHELGEKTHCVDRVESLEEQISRLAAGNVTVERQLHAFAMHVMPHYAQDKDYAWALAAILLPSPMTPNPAALLDRISRLTLAVLTSAELEALRRIARRGTIDPDFLACVASDLDFNRAPVRALFMYRRVNGELEPDKLFPRARQALLTDQGASIQAEAEDVSRRLELLWTYRRLQEAKGQPEVPHLQAQLLPLLEGSDLTRLPLALPVYERCVRELAWSLASADGGADGARCCHFVDLFTRVDHHATALPLLARAELTSLHGDLHFRVEAGRWGRREHEAFQELQAAHAMADAAVRSRGLQPGDDAALMDISVRLAMAGLIRAGLWDLLLTGHAQPVQFSSAWDWEVLLQPAVKNRPVGHIPTLVASTEDAPSRARGLRVMALHAALRGERDAVDTARTAAEAFRVAGDEDRHLRGWCEAAVLARALGVTWDAAEPATVPTHQGIAAYVHLLRYRLSPALDQRDAVLSGLQRTGQLGLYGYATDKLK
ncbi:MAG: hypothetical protein ABIO70_08460 [Pseudomonadota bacterium]